MPYFENQNPASFGWSAGGNANIAPFIYAGHEFPRGVAAGTHRLWSAALDLICAQPGFTLPDPRPSVGGCWGYADRLKKSGAGLSFHAFGLALDVAAPWNPFDTDGPPPSPHRMPINTGQLVRPLGMIWGGDFRGVKDWMHIELHLSPSEVDALDPADLFRLPLEPTARSYPLPPGYYYGPRSGPVFSVSNQVRPTQAGLAGLRWAQQRLGVTADGLYGPHTASATVGWQRSHGLVADGLIGPRTWASLAG
jgi:peptidoglycan hydrolase-like protein with peptidoglycan-binding domain